MASNRAQILISAVDQTKTAFDSIKRGLGGLTDTAKSVNGVLANLGVGVSLAGIGAMIKSSIDSADALDEMVDHPGAIAFATLRPVARRGGLFGQYLESAGNLPALVTVFAFKLFDAMPSQPQGGNA